MTQTRANYRQIFIYCNNLILYLNGILLEINFSFSIETCAQDRTYTAYIDTLKYMQNNTYKYSPEYINSYMLRQAKKQTHTHTTNQHCVNKQTEAAVVLAGIMFV